MLGQLYYPTGKALETAQQVLEIDNPMACNMAYGCPNMCDYCYVPFIKKGHVRLPKENPIKLVTEQLENGLKPKGVFLSFATDPFIKVNIKSTMRILEILTHNKIRVATLSKVDGILINMNHPVRTGMTIVSDNDEFSKRFEPNALPNSRRIEILKDIHHIGNYTWVSLEPFVTPNIFEQSLVKLLSKIDFVDFIIFGKLNYDKRANNPEFYKKMVTIFDKYCDEQGIRHFVKSETRQFININQIHDVLGVY